VSAFGTKNASSTNGWLTPRPIVRSEKDWSIVCARCITNVNGAVSDDRVVNNLRTARAAFVLGSTSE